MIGGGLWTHFATVTFRHNPAPERAIAHWRSVLAKSGARKMPFVRVEERHVDGGVHFHSLIYMPHARGAVMLQKNFRRWCGVVDFSAIKDQTETVSAYCVKYVSKAIHSGGEFSMDFSRGFRRLPGDYQLSFGLRGRYKTLTSSLRSEEIAVKRKTPLLKFMHREGRGGYWICKNWRALQRGKQDYPHYIRVEKDDYLAFGKTGALVLTGGTT